MSSTPPLAPRPLERRADLAPGRLVGDRFEIRACMGEGALGTVYRAYDREIEVEVALKVLREELLPDTEARARFLERAAPLARLSHQNLVRVFRVAQDGPFVYLAMQLLEGPTLREVMNRRREQGTPFTIEEVEPYVSQIAAALGEGHKLSPHGDLRPENVVILPNLVKVSDFGVAALVATAPFVAASSARGGDGYLAPEVRAGEEPSAAGDVYGLGVLTAELFTGALPDPQFRLRAKRADLPDTLEALLGNALALDASVRIADPALFARGVRGHVADQAALSVASRTRSVVRPTQVGAGRDLSQSGAAPAPSTLAVAAAAAGPPAARPLGGAASRDASTPPRGTPLPAAPPEPARGGSQPRPIPVAPPPLEAPEPGPGAVTAQPPPQRLAPAPVSAAAPHPPRVAEQPPYELEPSAGNDRTTVLPPESAILVAAGARPAQRQPLPLGVWIALILLLVAGATYGAVLYLESSQKEAEAALVAEQERERAQIAQQREAVRVAREAAERKAAEEAAAAKRKADEAARLAASDPAKKAEAERLAAEAKKKEEERLALEKKRTEEEKRESAEDDRRERAEAKKEARKQAEKAREAAATPAVTGPATPPPQPAQAPVPVKPPESGPRPELVASATALPEKKKGCPEGMARVKAGGFRMGSADDDPMRNFSERRLARVKTDEYCIDRFEFPNRRGARPRTGVSWDAARSACEAAGRRLCTEAEWERACKGFGGLRFPYGDDFDDEKCNTETKAGEKRAVTAAGAFTGCKSGFGVYDLSGNVAEWTSTPLSPGARAMIIKGGAANKPDWAVRCANRGNKPAGSSDAFLGFRCCATPE